MNPLYSVTDPSDESGGLDDSRATTPLPAPVPIRPPKRSVGRRVGIIVFAEGAMARGDVSTTSDLPNAVATDTNVTSTANDISRIIPKSIISDATAKRARRAHELALKLRSQDAEAAAREVMSLFGTDGDPE